MFIYWRVYHGGALLFSTQRQTADTTDARDVRDTLVSKFPKAEGYSVRRVRVHVGSPLADQAF